MALSPARPLRRRPPTPVELRILAINDFHGYLRPPPGGIRIADPEDKTKKIVVPAGGSGADGDAGQATSRGPQQHDLRRGRRSDRRQPVPARRCSTTSRPSSSLSMMGLAISSVGNHEFDEGKDELLRMQNGGCHPVDTCQGPHPFLGREIPLPRRQHGREEHRQDRVSRLTRSGNSRAFRSPSSG